MQIAAGIVLGPGVLGHWFPDFQHALFSADTTKALSAIAAWSIMLFVFSAGLELDVGEAWRARRETLLASILALLMPMALGAAVAFFAASADREAWIGNKGTIWQFVLGIGMASAVTALPILVLFLEKLGVLHQALGQKVLRIASLDDITIWMVLGLILLDWQRLTSQVLFIAGFAASGLLMRKLVGRLRQQDRWAAALMWLLAAGYAADTSGLHFMVGAFLAGAVLDGNSFGHEQNARLRQFLLLALMPVFFLSTGLRAQWSVSGFSVAVFAAALLIASISGKILGVWLAGRRLGWPTRESLAIGWLLQTKALIMIIFTSVLLDKDIITPAAFAATLLMALASTMITIPMVDRLGLIPTPARQSNPPR